MIKGRSDIRWMTPVLRKGLQSVARAGLAGKHVAFAGSSPCAQPPAQQVCVLESDAGPMTLVSESNHQARSRSWALTGRCLGHLQAHPLSGQCLGRSSNRRYKAMQGHFSLHLAFERDLTPFHRVNPWTKAESGFFKWILKCSINWGREVRS